ncbi:3,4-dihydroxy-2-butanone 4-phosphate synthase [Archaeoglobus sulfaticallidus PM70-1]|uniref:3,4-dihydroxy-2-butanone 4-phosphate synthase n=1 Tax=Archaeoglobus sulfaticallidus PM70-1 TaxID=387631 RepID=N0BEJ5_9EURY|nr:3,4-dihydroxy-2-butanone-4-phosphate synthase [Archaeoglobus sulfaticallidus]AGK62039.1 3,4-dihydroxy-2-butanone 4-phosphate synthase [Archaeoglobus sulfaticallidus PM70-1]
MIDEALKAFRRGEPVLIYDFDHREGETDIAIPAVNVSHQDVAMMRIDGGGLICVAIHPIAADKLQIPFMHDVLAAAGEKMPYLLSLSRNDIKYDSRSSFAVWVNHRDTFTGITDIDRALTIRRVGEVVDMVMTNGEFDFASEFRSPGHVALLRAAVNLTYDRVGQTELSVALAEMAGISPAVAICEMLDAETGKALSKEKAIEYAEERGIPFVEGDEIVEYYRDFKEVKVKLFI